MTDSAVKVSGDGKKKKAPRWQLAVAVVVAVIIAAGAGALMQYVHHRGKQASIADKSIVYPDSVNNSKTLLQSGKADDADKAVADALSDTSLPSEERRLLYIEQARIAIVKEDYRAAVEALAKAWNIKQTYDVANKLGVGWQQLGDNAKALEYYRKALELNPKDSPTHDSENRILQQMITALEQQS